MFDCHKDMELDVLAHQTVAFVSGYAVGCIIGHTFGCTTWLECLLINALLIVFSF